MMMTETMTSITTDQNEIISSIQQLSPKSGDILMFYVKTDKDGIPMIDMETLEQTAKVVENVLNQKKLYGLFLLDKICLFSVDDAKAAIKTLENCISDIREAMDKAENIENEKFLESVKVDFKCGNLGQ